MTLCGALKFARIQERRRRRLQSATEQQQLHVPIACYARRRLLMFGEASAADSASPSDAAAAAIESREWLECTASGVLLVAHPNDPRAFFDADAAAQASSSSSAPLSVLSGSRLQKLLAGELPDPEAAGFDAYRRVAHQKQTASTNSSMDTTDCSSIAKSTLTTANRVRTPGEGFSATGTGADSISSGANSDENPLLDTSQPSSICIWEELQPTSLESAHLQPSSLQEAPPSSLHEEPPSSLQSHLQPPSKYVQYGAPQASSLPLPSQRPSIQFEAPLLSLMGASIEAEEESIARSRSVGSSDRLRLRRFARVASRNSGTSLSTTSAQRHRQLSMQPPTRLLRLPSCPNNDEWDGDGASAGASGLGVGARHHSLRFGREISLMQSLTHSAYETLLRMRLEVLDLSTNQLRSLEPLAELAKSEFPLALALFKHLQKLSLAENALTDLPVELFLPISVQYMC